MKKTAGSGSELAKLARGLGTQRRDPGDSDSDEWETDDDGLGDTSGYQAKSTSRRAKGEDGEGFREYRGLAYELTHMFGFQRFPLQNTAMGMEDIDEDE